LRKTEVGPILVFFANFFLKAAGGAGRKPRNTEVSPLVVFFAKLSFFLILRGAGRKLNTDVPCPIEVFFAKLSFFQKKAERKGLLRS